MGVACTLGIPCMSVCPSADGYRVADRRELPQQPCLSFISLVFSINKRALLLFFGKQVEFLCLVASACVIAFAFKIFLLLRFRSSGTKKDTFYKAFLQWQSHSQPCKQQVPAKQLLPCTLDELLKAEDINPQTQT